MSKSDKPNSSIPTPRTDKEEAGWGRRTAGYLGVPGHEMVRAEFAHQLERELAEAKADLKGMDEENTRLLNESTARPSLAAQCPDPRGHLFRDGRKRCYFCGASPPSPRAAQDAEAADLRVRLDTANRLINEAIYENEALREQLAALSARGETIIDHDLMEKIKDPRYSAEWIGNAVRIRVATVDISAKDR